MSFFDKNSEYCGKCKAFHGPGNHRPIFKCWLPDDDGPGSSTEIHAYDTEAAAEAYMDYCWSDRDGWEWILGRNGDEQTHTVLVRKPDGDTRTVEVTVEMRPHYSARELS